MSTDLFIVNLAHKHYVFLRNESGYFYDITKCQPSTYNKFGINLHGVLRKAKRVTSEYVGDLLADHSNEYQQVRVPSRRQRQQVLKGRAASKNSTTTSVGQRQRPVNNSLEGEKFRR